MLRLLVAAVLVGVGLSGCASESAESAGPASASVDLVSDTTGAIIGTVVDDTLAPVVGATVGVKEGAAATTTDANGDFSLGGLEPGEHAVFATALGYESGGRTATVVAGETVQLQFMLQRLPTEMPYTDVKIFAGLIECGFGTAAVVGNCVPLQFLFDQIGQNPTATRTVGKYEIADPAKVAGGVFEMVWTPSTGGSGQRLGLYVDEDGAGPTSGRNYAQSNGPSPVKIGVDEEPYKNIKPSKKVQTRTFLPGTTPPSYVVNQRFEVFGTACYVAPCAEDYTALKDG